MTTKTATPARLHLGAAYHPQHWPEIRWPEDIRLMREAELTVVRLADFDWPALEPVAGNFRFDWLDRAIAALADGGLATVLGTPTAAPPAWLVAQHPNVMAVEEAGCCVPSGNRSPYCVNSPELHAAIRRIVGAMAERFGDNPHVIGWQLDNKCQCVCHCNNCLELFQRYLAERYGSLEALNRHWTTTFRGHTYSAWQQIPIPVGSDNPGLMLAFKQFVTESCCRFQRLQLDVLRPHLRPDVWVTNTFTGWFDGFDHYVMAQDIDFASGNWYVGMGHNRYLTSGAKHDFTRGLKRQSFWLIESRPDNAHWTAVNNGLNKGEARAMAWHAVAHGADAVLYWQWRSALNGQEQFHGKLVDQSGQPRLFYEEAQQLGRDFAAVSSLLAGSKAVARVALLNSYDSRWSNQWQGHHRDFDHVAHLDHYYRPLAARNISVDVISADEPLKGYRLVIAPALIMLNEIRVQHLMDFVQRGGHLVLTVRCGLKNEHNALLPSRPPGPLAALSGVVVEEYYALQEPAPVVGNWFEGVSRLWAERLKLRDESSTQVIARYGASNGWLDDQIAITVRGRGRALIYTVGAYLDDDAQQKLMDRIIEMAGVKPVLETPPGVGARLRRNPDGVRVFIVVNHEREEKRVFLPWSAHEHLSGQAVSHELQVSSYGVAVLTQSK